MKVFFLIVLIGLVLPAHAQMNDEKDLAQTIARMESAYKGGQLDEALKEASLAVTLSTKIFGPQHKETAMVLFNQGLILKEKKDFKEAAEVLEKAIVVLETRASGSEKDLLACYSSLGESYFLSNKLKKAQEAFLKNLELSKKVFGDQAKESFSPTLYLANAYALAKDFDLANEYYLKCYALVKKFFGDSSQEMERVDLGRSFYYMDGLKPDSSKRKEINKKYASVLGYEVGDAIHLEKPSYPTEARQQLKQGKISVRISIDEYGKVKEAKAVLGDMMFAQAAEQAAKRCLFKPTIKNGKSVAITNFVTYRFAIS